MRLRIAISRALSSACRCFFSSRPFRCWPPATPIRLELTVDFEHMRNPDSGPDIGSLIKKDGE
ncbi:MAG: hypothetical protein M3480_06050 [Verrucomicrobiota bacterium]|nr:hypothetical protein [Chthoniobacterales bacterium]MDQ3414522.1 hypothetical protein [Verrucomicrobiota bacterium]